MELQEIREKKPGEASSISVESFVNKYFKNVMKKILYINIYIYYCKDNWAKMTKRYYGIKWKMVTKADSDFKHFH